MLCGTICDLVLRNTHSSVACSLSAVPLFAMNAEQQPSPLLKARRSEASEARAVL